MESAGKRKRTARVIRGKEATKKKREEEKKKENVKEKEPDDVGEIRECILCCEELTASLPQLSDDQCEHWKDMCLTCVLSKRTYIELPEVDDLFEGGTQEVVVEESEMRDHVSPARLVFKCPFCTKSFFKTLTSTKRSDPENSIFAKEWVSVPPDLKPSEAPTSASSSSSSSSPGALFSVPRLPIPLSVHDFINWHGNSELAHDSSSTSTPAPASSSSQSSALAPPSSSAPAPDSSFLLHQLPFRFNSIVPGEVPDREFLIALHSAMTFNHH